MFCIKNNSNVMSLDIGSSAQIKPIRLAYLSNNQFWRIFLKIEFA